MHQKNKKEYGSFKWKGLLKYTLGSIIFGLALLILFIAYNSGIFTTYFKDIFERNIGISQTSHYIGTFFSLFILYLAICLAINMIFLIINKPCNKWILVTILGMLFLLHFGLDFIDSEIGNKDLQLPLIDDYNYPKIVGQFNCTNSNRVLLINDTINCQYSPKLFNDSVYVIFSYDDGKNDSIIKMQDMSFQAPNDIRHVHFRVEGYNQNGKLKIYSYGVDYKFLNREEFRQNRKEFITYVLALFGIILFSIPSLAVNFQTLYYTNKGKNEKEYEKINESSVIKKSKLNNYHK